VTILFLATNTGQVSIIIEMMIIINASYAVRSAISATAGLLVISIFLCIVPGINTLLPTVY